ncbi:hypothetical protein GGR50DRAFT_359250 [Xylaria sp. CBS 124048]|nr:hypothetical protein GGR50DRAFT_359250 [Xylaria sp. CBS 124048]
MSTIPKTIIITGGSSGIGFEAAKQLLAQSQPYNFIIGARHFQETVDAFNGLNYDGRRHDVTILPLQLNDMLSVKEFACDVIRKLSSSRLDYVLLNAATGLGKQVSKRGPHGSRWVEPYLVNHLAHHYLLQLLRPKLERSRTRILFSAAIHALVMVKDIKNLENIMTASIETEEGIYYDTKFIQLLNAHWWHRQLKNTCVVLAVSPGSVPNTGIYRTGNIELPHHAIDTISVNEAARNLVRGLTVDDFPEDRDEIFLLSDGDFLASDYYRETLDERLQERWSPSLEVIEKQEGITG